MSATAPTMTRSLRALRGAAVLVVAVGYLAVLNATAIGNGWRLVPHLALEHNSTVAAPGVLEDETGAVILTTLRETHHHGGHVHSHGPGPSHADATPTSRTHAHPASRPALVLEGDLHEHDGVIHSHSPPPVEDAVVATVSLDKHRPSSPAAVPAALMHLIPGVLEGGEAWTTREGDVETPPPIGRS